MLSRGRRIVVLTGPHGSWQGRAASFLREHKWVVVTKGEENSLPTEQTCAIALAQNKCVVVESYGCTVHQRARWVLLAKVFKAELLALTVNDGNSDSGSPNTPADFGEQDFVSLDEEEPVASSPGSDTTAAESLQVDEGFDKVLIATTETELTGLLKGIVITAASSTSSQPSVAKRVVFQAATDTHVPQEAPAATQEPPAAIPELPAASQEPPAIQPEPSGLGDDKERENKSNYLETRILEDSKSVTGGILQAAQPADRSAGSGRQQNQDEMNGSEQMDVAPPPPPDDEPRSNSREERGNVPSSQPAGLLVYRRGIDYSLLKAAHPSALVSQADAAAAGLAQSGDMSRGSMGAASKLLSDKAALFFSLGGSQVSASGSAERPPAGLPPAPPHGSMAWGGSTAMGGFPPVLSGFPLVPSGFPPVSLGSLAVPSGFPPARDKGLGGLPYPPLQKQGGGQMPGLGFLPGGFTFSHAASQGLPPPWAVSAPSSAGRKTAPSKKATKKEKRKQAASVESEHGQVKKKGKGKAKTERKEKKVKKKAKNQPQRGKRVADAVGTEVVPVVPYDLQLEHDPRPIILFDLNGTLTQHRSQMGGPGSSSARPGIRHLRKLQKQFRLGVYSSATESTVWTVLPMLEAAAGTGPRLFTERQLILHRRHTQNASHAHRNNGGNDWDTIKPLKPYFDRLHRILLVDDDSYKAVKSEVSNMILVPCWDASADDQVLQFLVESILRLLDGVDEFTDLRPFSRQIANSVLTAHQQTLANGPAEDNVQVARVDEIIIVSDGMAHDPGMDMGVETESEVPISLGEDAKVDDELEEGEAVPGPPDGDPPQYAVIAAESAAEKEEGKVLQD